jgi:D-amino-acid oxidase
VTYISVDAVVIGAGIMGLTTALGLAQAGLEVRVVARDLPPDTSSCAAGAMWGPFGVSRHERAWRWAHVTLKELRRLATGPSCGVAMVDGLEASRRDTEVPPWLQRIGARPCPATELPVGYRSGWRYTTAVLDMPVYLGHLSDELERKEVKIEQAHVADLREIAGMAPVTVNCTGNGARDLAGDESLRPVEGRVVVVENPGVDRFFADFDEGPEMTYFIPHATHLVLGSTFEEQPGPGADGVSAEEGIVRRCAAVEPAIAGAPVLESRRGVRPMRHRIRLEATTVEGRPVIHNYGHGGGGVSVSWGCAYEVVSLVRRLGHAPRTLS